MVMVEYVMNKGILVVTGNIRSDLGCGDGGGFEKGLCGLLLKRELNWKGKLRFFSGRRIRQGKEEMHFGLKKLEISGMKTVSGFRGLCIIKIILGGFLKKAY